MNNSARASPAAGASHVVVPRTSHTALPGKVYSAIPQATHLPADLDRAQDTVADGALKTVHRYSGVGGKLIVELLTPPQVAPTYMGGSKERGRGSLRGRIQLYCMEKSDRISDVRIKLKAEVSIEAPWSVDTSDELSSFSNMAPSTSRTWSKEQVLLQLDQRLTAVRATYKAVEGGVPKANKSGTFAAKGIYEWNFEFDIPALANKRTGTLQPFPGVGVSYPSSYLLESDMMPGASKREEWASVKWYLKCTVERAGLFRGKDRLVVPFIYLPPPPESVHKTLARRQALSQQIQGILTMISGPVSLPESLVEKQSRWRSYPCEISDDSLDVNERRGFLKRIFSTKRVERWAITIPADPLAAYPLRSTIPIVLTLMDSSTSPIVAHPHVFLIQRVQLRGRTNATHHQVISHARVFPSRVAQNGMQQWFAAVQFPSWCSPSFETSMLGLDYYLLVKPTERSESESLLTIPVALYCPPPRVVSAQQEARARRAIMAQSPARAAATHSPRDSVSSRSPSSSSMAFATPAASFGTATPPPPPPPPVHPHAAASQSVASLQHHASHIPSALSRPASLSTMRLPDSPPRHAHQFPIPAAPGTPGAPGLPYGAPALPAVPPALPPRTIRSPSNSQSSRIGSPVPHANVLGSPVVPSQAAYASAAASAEAENAILAEYTGDDSHTAAESDAAAEVTSISATSTSGVHDAGALTHEEEYQWTMNMLENALHGHDDTHALELPPSYFEATGIRDVE
ncbi:hypothetical protein MCUN1_003889 [Malassezia cuniculi]|uniref:Uncharacterized protein n=1 Tax=Malassezia cuniculi TaxID=948313 RepID=A0AAF0F244_9BASI|nr:hypothetical protein MCUN1_003889 [Malassezia cuniculi]